MKNFRYTKSFDEEYAYDGKDLGAVCTPEGTDFRLWAPFAEKVELCLYGSENREESTLQRLEMKPEKRGVWHRRIPGDLHGRYYDYCIVTGGEALYTADPYAVGCGCNGYPSMVVDLRRTDPEGFDRDHAPERDVENIIYELHIKDFSYDPDSGVPEACRGKYKAFTAQPDGNAEGREFAPGVAYLKELGITHVHLLPFFDYGFLDEDGDGRQFNWGYDPVNYNVPEGSYSTDPYNGEVRVKEMKQMVQGLHENGISVVMDVVYNHVYNASEFCFNQIVPGYFSRIDEEGNYSNGSGCGNDTASEREMVRKYIVESVKYWAEEYHIDGFRFDLVGLLDTQTVNEIVEEVHKDYPDVIFYGEGWTMDTTLTKEGYVMATQINSAETPEFAYFNDTLRDALKGSVFETSETGYVSGAEGLEGTIVQNFFGAADWCSSPSQTVNYASCHDNLTLMDRITRSTINESRADRVRMNNLSAAIYMTSQGIPFMQAGEEMLRTKMKSSGEYDENSFSSPDSVNSLKWDTLNEEEYLNTYNYYKGLIAFRKAHPALRMTTAEDVEANITSVENLDANVTAFEIKGGANGDSAEGMFIIFNPNGEETKVTLPDGVWDVYINGEKAGTEVLETITDNTAAVAPISAMVLVKGEGEAQTTVDAPDTDTVKPVNKGLIAGAAAGIVVVAAGIFVVVKKRKK